jgi:hypothetical protein
LPILGGFSPVADIPNVQVNKAISHMLTHKGKCCAGFEVSGKWK